MKQFVISFYGSSGDGMISYDDSPCISLDMAAIFQNRHSAVAHIKKLLRYGYYRNCELRVEEVLFD